MTTIVTSNNTAVFRQLGAPAFQRLGLRHVVAQDGPEAVQRVREERPEVAILNAEMPGLSGFEVCRQIKGDPELRETRVVLVLEGGITADQLAALADARCDEVLVAPAPGEDLFHRIAKLLGAPDRAYCRIAVSLRAQLGSKSETLQGHVVDLSPDGARLELPRSLGKAQDLQLRIEPSEGEEPVMARAKVVWERPAPDGKGVVSGVTLQGIGERADTVIRDLTLWQIERLEDGTTQVVLQGDIVENTDFSRLLARLPERVQFDLGRVRYLNSSGVKRWVEFLRLLSERSAYHFVRGSVAFVTQASMVPQVVGNGRVESFYAPYACEECDHEEERLVQTAALAAGGAWPPELPPVSCRECGALLYFDDVPARYLAFLAR